MPKMIPVQSSNLVAVGYEPASMKLYIQFHDGAYVYYDVPQHIFEGLMNAASHGKYHAAYIRNSFPYHRL